MIEEIKQKEWIRMILKLKEEPEKATQDRQNENTDTY